MTTRKKTDFLAIGVSVGIAVVGVIAQFFISAISYGQLLEKVSEVQRRETASETAQLATNVIVSEQKAQLAGFSAKMDGIKSVIDRVDGKLDGEKPR